MAKRRARSQKATPGAGGTVAYQNWHAALAAEPAGDTYEYPLFSDVRMAGEMRAGLGPYSVLNALADAPLDPVTPVLVLRVTNYLHETPELGVSTEASTYHGGTSIDEIAALLSLHLGRRLKAGAETRWFKIGGDPLGIPENIKLTPNPTILRSRAAAPIPRLRNDVTIGPAAGRLAHFPTLAAENAVAIVRAARLYQDAIWLAETEPAITWLLLVSALETAASHWGDAKYTPREELSLAKPELEKLLVAAGGDELADKAAEMLKTSFGSTRRFRDFVSAFLGERPEPSPAPGERLTWTAVGLKTPLNVVYNHRSRALHAGTPFPSPMSFAPRERDGAYAERMLGGSVGTLGSTWAAKDLPMNLHAFEHLTRGVLLKWWDALATAPR
jgi:hypothetical protein